MSKLTEQTRRSIRILCEDVRSKSVTRLVLMTKQTPEKKTTSRFLPVASTTALALAAGGLALWAELGLLVTCLIQLTIAALFFASYPYSGHKKFTEQDKFERIRSEAITAFKELSPDDRDRQYNVLVFLCPTRQKLFLILGDNVALLMPRTPWANMIETFEKETRNGNLETALIHLVETLSHMLKTSAPKIPLGKNDSAEAVASTVSNLCGSVLRTDEANNLEAIIKEGQHRNRQNRLGHQPRPHPFLRKKVRDRRHQTQEAV